MCTHCPHGLKRAILLYKEISVLLWTTLGTHPKLSRLHLFFSSSHSPLPVCIHPFIHSFILCPCARHHSRCWRDIGEDALTGLCCQDVYILQSVEFCQSQLIRKRSHFAPSPVFQGSQCHLPTSLSLTSGQTRIPLLNICASSARGK